MENVKTYIYHLKEEPFYLIESGKKTVEMRLYDEKRQLLKIGDYIIFKNKNDESKMIKTKILKLHRFKSFNELYKNINHVILGYSNNEKADPNDMKKYYSQEDEDKYGVVGIEIEVKK